MYKPMKRFTTRHIAFVLGRVKLPLAVKLLHVASTISLHMTDVSKVTLPYATKAEEEQG